jgi:hypothetical protein
MKPATQITDRAKRYRANSETSDWPRVCMFCGSTDDLQVDHLDGYEENGEPENLLMLCRSCNQLKSAVYKKAGIGRRTVQFNPADAVARHKGFTILKRGRGFFTTVNPELQHLHTKGCRAYIDDYKNPAKSADDWATAVATLRGESKRSPAEAARTIRSTPINRRYQYLDRVMRANPAVPTFEQYAWAVRNHEKGPYLGRGKWGEGAHDEGGAIIHATPKSKRKEYAGRIQKFKSGQSRAAREAERARWE